jgi:hypothetical protein
MTHNATAQSGGGNVDGVALLAAVVFRCILHAQEIQGTNSVAPELLHGVYAGRGPKGLPEVASRTASNEDEEGRGGNGRVIRKEAVHHLVQRPVPADR